MSKWRCPPLAGSGVGNGPDVVGTDKRAAEQQARPPKARKCVPPAKRGEREEDEAAGTALNLLLPSVAIHQLKL